MRRAATVSGRRAAGWALQGPAAAVDPSAAERQAAPARHRPQPQPNLSPSPAASSRRSPSFWTQTQVTYVTGAQLSCPAGQQPADSAGGPGSSQARPGQGSQWAEAPRQQREAGDHRPSRTHRELNREIARAKTPSVLALIIQEKGQHFDHVNVACALCSLARSPTPTSQVLPALRRLEGLASDLRGTFNAISLAQSARALSRLGAVEAQSLRLLEDEALRLQRTLKPQAVAMVAGAFARLGRSPPAVFDALASRALEVLADCSDRDLAELVWCFAKARHCSPALMQELCQRLLPRLGELSNISFSMVLYGLALDGHPSSVAVFLRARHEVLRRQASETPLDVRQLANVCWAFARTDQPAPSVFDIVASSALPQLGRFSSQELSQLAWAFAASGHESPRLLAGIEHEVLRGSRLKEFTPQGLAMLVWSLAKAGMTSPALLDAVAVELSGPLSTLSAQGIAMVAWAYARAGHTAPALLNSLAARAARRIDDFQPQGLAMVAWAYASLRVDGQGLLSQLLRTALGDLSRFGPQPLAMLLWAAAQSDSEVAPQLMAEAMSHLGPRLHELSAPGLAMAASACSSLSDCRTHLDAMAPFVEPRLPGASPWDIAWLALSFAAHGAIPKHSDRHDLFGALEREALQRIDEFGPVPLSLLGQAFARAPRPSIPLLEAVAMRAQGLIQQMKPNDAAMLAWAFSKSQCPAGTQLLPALAEHLGPSLHVLTPMEMSHLAWAYARGAADGTGGPEAEELLAALGEAATPRLGAFKAQGVASLAWAFASGRLDSPELFSAIGSEAQRRLPEFNAQDLSTLAWALSRQAKQDPQVVADLLTAAAPLLPTCGPQGLAMMLWSAALAGHPAEGFLATALPHARRHLRRFNQQSLAMALWAYSQARHLEVADFFEDACAIAIARLPESTDDRAVALLGDALELAGEGAEHLHEAWHEAVRRRAVATRC